MRRGPTNSSIDRFAASLGQSDRNRFQNGVRVLKYLIVPKPEHAKPLLPKPRCTSFVVIKLDSVLTAVQLDDQSMRKRNEINDIVADGSLSSEFDSIHLANTQMPPQSILSIGGLISH